MKIVFFGASKFVLSLIEMLNENFQLVLVITTERDPMDSVPTYCQNNNIPYLSVKTISEAQEHIKKTHAELGALAYFGLLLPKEILTLFPQGIINIHPSLLPLYRGATPVQSALLAGDDQTGVTIIKLDEQMDHGPILAQEHEKILPTDTTATLHEKLFKKGTIMLQKILPEYLNNDIPMHQQEDSQASYTKRSFSKTDGFIDSTNPPDSTTLKRMIRAYFPWPAAWTKFTINGQEKIVKLLPEGKLQVEGKRPLSVKDFINGYPQLKEQIEKLGL